jgi:thiamine pyrophosphate-dependent acetolactate synthase large subunit-like protein
MNGGERLAAVLAVHGVRTLFTLCGGHISPLLVAAKARGLRVTDVRDEASAVFAADATARLTGIPGVAAVTAGPGVANAITALKNAQLAQSPLVLIGGAAPTALQGRGALQDIDQQALVAPHVKFLRRVRRVAHLDSALTDAFAAARDGVPGPAFVECPVDLLYDETTIRQWYAEAGGRGQGLSDRLLRWVLERHAKRLFAGAEQPFVARAGDTNVPRAPEGAVARAASALARAERPVLVVGSQALAQATNAARVAGALDRIGAPVYLSGMARGLLGREHALHMRHARREALRQSDCVLLAGVACDFRLDYGRHVRRAAKLISANRSARDARLNRTPSIAAIGDAGDFLERLAASLGERARRPEWIAELRARDQEREADIDARAAREGEFVNPVALFRALDGIASDDALFVADGGDFVATASYILRPRSPLSWLDPGVFGTLGVGAGFALGAALARPSAELWLVWGDGASGFGLAEFDSFVRHGIPVIAVVGNDASWGQIARDQEKLLGDDVGTALARTAYHEVARGFGAEGFEVKHQRELEWTLRRARDAAAAGRPALVNVWLDKTDFREGSISM